MDITNMMSQLSFHAKMRWDSQKSFTYMDVFVTIYMHRLTDF